MNLTVEQVIKLLQEFPSGAETNVSMVYQEPSNYAGRLAQVVLWPADRIYDHTATENRREV